MVTADHINRLFSDENCNLPNRIKGMEQDIDLLNYAIGNNDIKTFDYKGVKYYTEQGHEIISQLKADIEQADKALTELDQEIYTSFYWLADDEARARLCEHYSALLEYQILEKQDQERYMKIINEMSPVYTDMKTEDIETTLNQVYETEKEVKPRLQEIITDGAYNPYMSAEHRAALEKYVAEERKYFVTRYSNTNLAIFNEAMDAYAYVITKRRFDTKNDLLNFQLSLLTNQITNIL